MSDVNFPLKGFPTDGWVIAPSVKFGEFLAKQFDQEPIKPGKKGYAWNRLSYWSISDVSSKPEYTLDEIYDVCKRSIDLQPKKQKKSEFKLYDLVFLDSDKYDNISKGFVGRIERFHSSGAVAYVRGVNADPKLNKAHTIKTKYLKRVYSETEHRIQDEIISEIEKPAFEELKVSIDTLTGAPVKHKSDVFSTGKSKRVPIRSTRRDRFNFRRNTPQSTPIDVFDKYVLIRQKKVLTRTRKHFLLLKN